MNAEVGDGSFDGAVEKIAAELRGMRRAQARATIDYLQAPTMVWHLGRGDIEVAALFFERLTEHDDIEIRAALASLGFENRDMNIEDRMQDFAQFYRLKSSRTVRRWTEAGFRKIAHLVIEWSREEGHDRPRAEIRIEPYGSTQFSVELICSKHADVLMSEPQINFYGKPFKWASRIPLERLESPCVFHAKGIANLPGGEDGRTMFFVSWLGNSDSYFEGSSQSRV